MENEERRNLRRWRSDDRAREKERQANDWRTFNEKTIKQAKTGLYIQNLCETEHPGDYERAGIVILESRRDLGCLYEMAPVRILLWHYFHGNEIINGGSSFHWPWAATVGTQTVTINKVSLLKANIPSGCLYS